MNGEGHIYTVRQMIYIWRKFSTTVNLPRSSHPAINHSKDSNIIVTKNPRVTSKDLQATLALSTVNVH